MTAMLGQMAALSEAIGTDFLFILGVMLLAGCATGAAAGRIRLPEITGFVLAGVLIGESGLGLVPRHLTTSMKLITEVALGLIALTIGSEFAVWKLKRMGRTVVLITGIQILGTFGLVLPTMLLTGMDPPFAIIIAAIATASSPAVIVAMVQGLRARGPFVDCLYGVIALLDAGAVVLFGIAFSVAAGMMGLAAGDRGAASLIIGAVGEVAFSIMAGMLTGVILHLAIRRRERINEVLLIAFGVMFIATAAANTLHLSSLLVMMTTGAVMINLSPRHHRVFRILEPITPPIFALFFVLAGCELQMGLLRQPRILIAGGAYVLARGIAKYLSTYAGAAAGGAPAAYRSNLGLCMLPQAGVSLGLVLMVQSSPVSVAMTPLQTESAIMLANVVLLSVFVNQLIGPLVAKGAIIRGNEMEAHE